MVEIVQDYLKLKSDISFLLKKSGFKSGFIAEKLGIQPTTFSVKRQRANWTDLELLKIMQIIDNEELEDLYLGKVMNEMKETEFVPLENFLQHYAN